MEEFLAPIRERRKAYEQDIPKVYEILRKGSEEARAKAAATLEEVKAAMKINYFQDEELIKAQAEAYRQK
jgi:tryptophanyl-tRNA synthetase